MMHLLLPSCYGWQQEDTQWSCKYNEDSKCIEISSLGLPVPIISLPVAQGNQRLLKELAISTAAATRDLSFWPQVEKECKERGAVEGGEGGSRCYTDGSSSLRSHIEKEDPPLLDFQPTPSRAFSWTLTLSRWGQDGFPSFYFWSTGWDDGERTGKVVSTEEMRPYARDGWPH